MTAVFHLRLFGSPHLTINGEISDGFKSQKAVALLAYLARQSQPVSRLRLADLLWPDKSEKRGRANLSWTLNNLRRLLPQGTITADRHTIHLTPDQDLWIDTAELITLSNPPDPTAAAQIVEQYRGPFMDGFFLEKCPEFDLWLVEEREWWRQQVVRTLRLLIEYNESKNDWQEALAYARRLLDIDPWREEAHRAAMRLLVIGGQRSAALAQYETCRRLLAAELGVEPTAETTALYEQIRQGKPDQTAPADDHPPTLPAPPTPFIGREREIGRIIEQLSNPDCKLLTLVGPGGIGKTRLALEAARRFQEQDRRSVYFVPLAAVDDTADLPAAIAQSLGFAFQSQVAPWRQLAGYLKTRNLILLLDNFEQLQNAAPRLSELLVQAPSLNLLVTSRFRLNLHGEWALPVEGLPYARSGTAEFHQPEQDSAGRLFYQAARRADPAFTLIGQEAAAVAEICELVGGMPLAIELSAAWVRLLSCAEIAAEIGNNLAFLTTTMPDIPDRHRSLTAVFNQSWQQLSEQEQAAAGALAVFRGGFHRRAAESVAGAALPVLFSLVDRAFIYKTDQGRYEMIEALRQFCEARLKSDKAAYNWVRQAHADYFGRLIRQQETRLHGPEEKATLAVISIELENARRAWRWAIEQKTAASAAILDHCQRSLERFYQVQGLLAEGAAAFGEAVRALSGLSETADKKILAGLLVRRGRLLSELGENGEARPLLLQALALAGETGQKETEALALLLLGNLSRAVDELEAAEEYLAQALPLAVQSRVPHLQAMILSNQGHLHIRKGEHEKADRLCRESLALFRQLGDRYGMAGALNGLGGIAYENGRYAEARRRRQESLALYQEIGNRAGMASSLAVLGAIAEGQGEYEEAEANYRESLTIFEEVGALQYMARLYNNLGNLALSTGRYGRAKPLLEQGLALSRETDNRRSQGRALNCLGVVARSQGDYPTSIQLHRESLTIRRQIGDRWGVGYSLDDLGQTYLLAGQTAEAAPCFEESLSIFREIGNRRGAADALNHLGQAAIASGIIDAARDYFQAALETAESADTLPQALDAKYGLALCLVQQDNVEAARQRLPEIIGSSAVRHQTRQAAQELLRSFEVPGN